MRSFFSKSKTALDTSYDESENVDINNTSDYFPEDDGTEFNYPIKKLQGSFDSVAKISNCETNTMKVYLRVRPSSSSKAESTVQVLSETAIKTIAPQVSKRAIYTKTEERKYTFARIFSPESSQEELFGEAMTPMVDRFMRGESCVVFAYGITNAGKTHTIQGTPTDYGILPRLISKLLDNFPQTELKFSMFEIYQEKIYDLLNKRALLNIRDANKKVEVSSLSLHPIANAKDAIKMMNKGASKRTNARTLLNSGSSRSHVVYTISINQQVFQVIDLAGAERGNRTKVSAAHQKEANNINMSLMILWRCLEGLRKRQNENSTSDIVPFRESKLTHFLMPLLCRTGTSGVVMIACVNPQQSDYDETMSVLGNASMAMEIMSLPQIERPLSTAHVKDKEVTEPQSTSKKRNVDSILRSQSQDVPDDLSNSDGASASESDLIAKIERLQKENILLVNSAMTRETEIRHEISNEMALRSAHLLNQIRDLQDELYSLKNDRSDITRSVKKAKRNLKSHLKDDVTEDLRDAEEEMESLKSMYEDRVAKQMNQITELTNELKECKMKLAEANSNVLSLKEKIALSSYKSSLSSASSVSVSSNVSSAAYHSNQENDISAAESFELRKQRDQRFNKHKRLADLSPESKKKSPTVREPLSPVPPGSQNQSVIVEETDSTTKITLEKSSSKPSERRLSPPPMRSHGDGSPIAPPQQSNIAGANIFYNRTLRSHNLRTLNIY